ncbi:hypothetical protein ABZ897_47325 [Nonomuraea sp. NPDC046802]|uniref:hypothetical protein n=1 Tax=Nonomuraea sp. NPDC046802 TaxID=3154919 RepID=UPI003401B046
MLRHTLAGGLMLATSLVLTAGPGAHADIYAPYARAAAIVDANGTLNNFKNVVSSRLVSRGKYCVRVRSNVDVREALIQITSRDPVRLPQIAYRHPSPTCNEDNTVAVHVYNSSSGQLADGGFDFAIL